MTAGGVMPTEEGTPLCDGEKFAAINRWAFKVRLDEFDRLMAEGGIEAVMKALEANGVAGSGF